MLVGAPPQNTDGRSKYGMGMKTAACWLGNRWTVRTKRLGEPTELEVTVDVEKVAEGDQALPTRILEDQDPDQHYTVVEITDLNRPLRGGHSGRSKTSFPQCTGRISRWGFLTYGGRARS